MRMIMILVVALALAACGGTPAARPSVDQAMATIGAGLAVATAAPIAMATPTSAPTSAPARPGLGISRSNLQARFENAPFHMIFVDATSDKDGPGVRGKATDQGVKIWLRGPPDDVQEAQVQAALGVNGASSADVLRAMITLLEATVPLDNATMWLEPHITKALKESTDVTIAGDRMITIIATPSTSEIKAILLSVRPAP